MKCAIWFCLISASCSRQNALMGDVILSPGGDGADQPIAALLRALPHPQYHSHSGIMTENYVQITHCTAVGQRLADYTVGPGIPIGIQPDVLQYAWPGSITQSIDAATEGQEKWIDPNGKEYEIGGFTPDALGIIANDEFVLVPPMVVKPLPEHEQQARPLLRKAAATALSKGARVDSSGHVTPPQARGAYYCFYGYTRPEIAAGFGDAAGPEAGWAQGASPAVCSSFVWLCMKENGIPLVSSQQYETPADLSPTSVSLGAEVGAGTLDGLFYYSAQAREEAAQVLDMIFQNQVLDQEGFFRYFDIGALGHDVALAIADQIMNMFAFGNPGMIGLPNWHSPGHANAVSPDNIPWWNPPYFGYAEPLQYLQRHTEQYTVSRWTQVITRGTISSTVTLNGAPVQGAYVYVYDGKSATTDSGGHYVINDVPIGRYNIEVSVVQGGMHYFDSEPIDLTGTALTVDLALHGLIIEYRTMELGYEIECDHGDANPFSAKGVEHRGPERQSFNLGPGDLIGGVSYKYSYKEAGLFHIVYQMNGTLALDLSIEMTLTATMYDESGNEQGQQTISFNVLRDGQYVWELDIECSSGVAWHNGPAKFTGTATNRQQTTG